MDRAEATVEDAVQRASLLTMARRPWGSCDQCCNLDKLHASPQSAAYTAERSTREAYVGAWENGEMHSR